MKMGLSWHQSRSIRRSHAEEGDCSSAGSKARFGVGWEHRPPLLFPGVCDLSCSDKALDLFCVSRKRPRIISCSVQLLLAQHLSQPFAFQRLQCGSRKEGPNVTCSSPDTDKQISKAPTVGQDIVASLVCATYTVDLLHSSERCFLLVKSLLG